MLGTHLDLDPAARLDSALRVRGLAPPGVPLVIAADVNDEPGSPAWQALSAGLVDAAASCGQTFPLRAPSRRIDGVFVHPAFEVADVQVVRPGPVTDHLPVVVALRWS